jgi:hypothetical protein
VVIQSLALRAFSARTRRAMMSRENFRYVLHLKSACAAALEVSHEKLVGA